MKFMNTTGRAVTLPSIRIQAGETVDVMETILNNKVVSFWVDHGDLSIQKEEPKTEQKDIEAELGEGEGATGESASDSTRYTARHNSRGVYFVFQGDRKLEDVTITGQDEATKFNNMSLEEQEEFLTTYGG